MRPSLRAVGLSMIALLCSGVFLAMLSTSAHAQDREEASAAAPDGAAHETTDPVVVQPPTLVSAPILLDAPAPADQSTGHRESWFAGPVPWIMMGAATMVLSIAIAVVALVLTDGGNGSAERDAFCPPDACSSVTF